MELVVDPIGATVSVVSAVVSVDAVPLVGPVVHEGASCLVVASGPQSSICEVLRELVWPHGSGGVSLHHCNNTPSQGVPLNVQKAKF